MRNIYIKILKNGTIFNIKGKLKDIPYSSKKIENYNFDNVKEHYIFFNEFIKPVFDIVSKENESYQFSFKTDISKKLLVCNIIPCIDSKGNFWSCDILIRRVYNNGIKAIRLRKTKII